MRTEVMMKRWVCTDDEQTMKKEILKGLLRESFESVEDAELYNPGVYSKMKGNPVRATIIVIIETEEKNGTLKTEVED